MNFHKKAFHLLRQNRIAPGISTRALNIHNLNAVVHAIYHGFNINLSVFIELDLFIVNTQILKRAAFVANDAYSPFKRVIRLSRCGKHRISRLHKACKRSKYCMRPRNEVRAHNCIFRAECTCKHPVKRITANVIITVAVCLGKVPCGHALTAESRKYARLISFLDFVDLGKIRSKFLFAFQHKCI